MNRRKNQWAAAAALALSLLPGLAAANAMPVRNTAYVEINDNDLANVGCFRKGNGEPLFQVAMVFAANINADATGAATIHLNEQVGRLLDDDIHKVRALQAQGIQVVATLLNNHQNAGWACFADDKSAGAFAAAVRQFVDKYGLDGVDIDDEYDACKAHYPDSPVRVATALRDALGGKILSKAMWHDVPHFAPAYRGRRLGDLLSFGLEMSYDAPGNCMNRVQAYLDQGVDKRKLGVGASTVYTSARDAAELNRCVAANDLGGGMMIFNLQAGSLPYLQAIWPDATARPGCLR